MFNMRWRFLLVSALVGLIGLVDARFLKGSCALQEGFCGNNGTCQAGPSKHGVLTHWCRCDDGYGGSNCEQHCDLDCGEGMQCIFDFAQRRVCVCEGCDEFGQRIKQCAVGFGGDKCDQKGYCHPNQCLNGGKCVGNGDEARCLCPSGLEGKYCENDKDECKNERPCFNGKCINLFGGFKCECPPEFMYPYCLFLTNGNENNTPSEPHIPCIVTKNGTDGFCQNSGVCITSSTGNQTTCACPTGFHGEICELNVDVCAQNPCENGATCSNIDGGFKCTCRAGYDGEFCENNVDDCIGHKCSPGSKCIDDVARYTCECEPGKMGTYCEMMNPCIADPQVCNHGDCIGLPDTGGFACNCDLGFTGELCNIDIDECSNSQRNRCQNGGNCVNLYGSWKCECPPGFNGTICEQKIVKSCESENVQCKNGGFCHVEPDIEPVCLCPQGFVGDRCEIACPVGRAGVKCELNLNEPICGKNLRNCMNDGVCNNGFCSCSANYTGNYCELSRRAMKNWSTEKSCSDSPCLNNATCINFMDSIGYACLCPEGFEGYVCEIRKDYCSPNPCFNGGTCKKQLTGYQCECPTGFVGKQCREMEECSQRVKCRNGGQCYQEGGKSKCECSFGYAGPRCEQRVRLEQFVTKEKLYREICEKRNCSTRAGDGNCDLDCNFADCDFDGGDCSGRQRPFAKCRYGNMCAHLFANGVCNQACNNEDCLFDGMDCMPTVSRCPAARREYCASRFANGICDIACNSDACGFDGGDCDNRSSNGTGFVMLSDIRVKLLMEPERFQTSGGEILMELSSTLRSVIRIQRDEEGPLVFEWNVKDDEPLERIEMDMTLLEQQNVLSSNIKRIRRDTGTRGVIVWLEMEVNDASKCSQTSSCLFSNSQSVVDYLSAEIAKKGATSFHFPIYEAMVAKPTRSTANWSSNNVIVLSLIGFILLGTAVAGVIVVNKDEQRSRKRRIVSAKVWMPPMENVNGKGRRSNTFSSSQNSLLASDRFESFDAKRAKCDSYNSVQPIISNNFGILEDMNNQNTEEQETLLFQAAGNGLITLPISLENVNTKDASLKRSVLHWLAGNNSGKPEELIIEEAERCIKAGADINAIDADENTPLMLAVKARRVRLVIILMRNGGNPTIFNKSERSALHEAAVNLDLRMIQILLTDKRLVDEINEMDRNGRTALMEIARLDGDVQIADYLLKKGAKIDEDGAERRESEVYKGRTALHYAAQVDNYRMVDFLLNLNASKDKADEAGQTPLMLAAKEGHFTSTKLLIQRGADLECKDLLEKDARQLAEAQHHMVIVELIDQSIVEREIAETALRQHMLNHGAKLSKNGRPTLKAVKRSASRKAYQPPPSRLSTIHTTPPPSDGSLCSVSPQHYLSTNSAATPPGFQYPTSPMSQYQIPPIGSDYYPQSNTSSSSGTSSAMGMLAGNMPDSSPEYLPHDGDMTATSSSNGSMWFGASSSNYNEFQPLQTYMPPQYDQSNPAAGYY